MRNITLILLLVVCWGSFAGASDLNSLEALVEQWVGLRKEIASEQQAWKQQKPQWKREIALLEEESRQLDEMIEREKQLTLTKESVTADQLARRDELIVAIDEVGEIVDRTTLLLSEIMKFVPDSLQSENILRGCNPPSGNRDSLATTKRLQQLVSALSEIESIQHDSHIRRELISLDGIGRREMDVVYLGLAYGLAVSGDNTVAAIGQPVSSGWKWDVDKNIAADVRKLIGIKQQKLPPEIINLPITNRSVSEVQQ